MSLKNTIIDQDRESGQVKNISGLLRNVQPSIKTIGDIAACNVVKIPRACKICARFVYDSETSMRSLYITWGWKSIYIPSPLIDYELRKAASGFCPHNPSD